MRPFADCVRTPPDGGAVLLFEYCQPTVNWRCMCSVKDKAHCDVAVA